MYNRTIISIFSDNIKIDRICLLSKFFIYYSSEDVKNAHKNGIEEVPIVILENSDTNFRIRHDKLPYNNFLDCGQVEISNSTDERFDVGYIVLSDDVSSQTKSKKYTIQFYNIHYPYFKISPNPLENKRHMVPCAGGYVKNCRMVNITVYHEDPDGNESNIYYMVILIF